jgi:hypothetical protein
VSGRQGLGDQLACLWRRFQVPLANFGVAAMIAVLTAVLALVMEDALPLRGSATFDLVRLLVAAAALAGLLAAVVWRGVVYDRTGTLFYVRMLDHRMQDWHTKAVRLAHSRRMSLRPVTPWVDFAARTRNGVADLVDDCARIITALNAAMLGDRDDTAYTIAANMRWPAALAVGAELPAVDKLRLLELDTPSTHEQRRAAEISFALPTEPPGPGVVDRELPPIKYPMPGADPGEGRVGLLLFFTQAARRIEAEKVFAGCGVGEYHIIQPVWVNLDRRELVPGCLTRQHFEMYAQVLPEAVAEVKRQAGDRELVVAAALPKALALALGWGLAQRGCRFFARTHLLLHDGERNSYLPVRAHPSQPAAAPHDAAMK